MLHHPRVRHSAQRFARTHIKLKLSFAAKDGEALYSQKKQELEKVLHSICQKIWKTQQWPKWKRLVFIPIPKKGNAKECANYCMIALISHASEVMVKILQARLQHYVNRELPGVQAGFSKGRGTPETKLPTSAGSWKKQESSRKTSTSVLLTMPKPLTV